jgi:tetratricopeptide (TPR) repeat protein
MSGDQGRDQPVRQRIRADRDVVAAGRDVTIQYFPGDEGLLPSSASNVRVPRQLPPDVSLFTGRAADLALLGDLLPGPSAVRASAVTICVVAGMAGVGKTALTVHWAHQVSELFPGGQLYVNLRGYDRESPLSPDQVLEGFLRALGALPGHVPSGREAQAGLFRTLAAGRRMLIVLDNARSADQVRPLLPGVPECLVIVTSRNRLSGLVAREGASRITLGALPGDEAIALLSAILGDDRVSSDTAGSVSLARQCAYLPLALRIAAEQAATRPRMRLTELTAELTGASERLDALSAPDDEATAIRPVLSWSYQALPPPAARAFRLLGLHTGPDITGPAAAALFGVSGSSARSLLDSLTGMHLLEQGGEGRYRFHDLLRDYAAEVTALEEPEEERRNAVRAMLAWYLQAAEAGQRLLWPGRGEKEHGGPVRPGLPFTTAEQAVEWYDSELGNIVAAMQLATGAGEYESACQLLQALRVYFAVRRPIAEWAVSCEIGLVAARHLHDSMAEARLLGHLATSYFYQQRFEDSLLARENSLALLRAAGSPLDEAMSLMNLGAVYTELGRHEDALTCLKRSLIMARQIGDRNCEGHTLENLGAAYVSAGKYEEAIIFLQQAIPVFSDTGRSHAEMHGLGLVLYRLALCCLGLHRYTESMEYCAQGLNVAMAVRDRMTEALTLDTQAKALQATGQISRARQSWELALHILEEVGYPGADEIRSHLSDTSHSAESGNSVS